MTDTCLKAHKLPSANASDFFFAFYKIEEIIISEIIAKSI